MYFCLISMHILTANSVTQFTVLGSELHVGFNTIRLRISFSGVVRTLSFTVQKTGGTKYNSTTHTHTPIIIMSAL